MRTSMLFAPLLATCWWSPGWAGAPILSNGPARTQSQEDANELIAMTWHRNIMGGDRALGLSLMDRNFLQHDVEEPSGSIEFVEFFAQPGGPPGTDGSRRSPANAIIKAQAEAARSAGKPLPEVAPRAARPLTLQTRLFTLTEGDLTLWAYASRGGDPGRFFGGNMVEIKNGKITQQWFSGPTFSLPADVKQEDPAQWYPGPYQQLENIQFAITPQTATSAQRASNRKLVTDFWDALFLREDATALALLSPDLRNHIPGQPSGAAFAEYAWRNPGAVTAPAVLRPLFVLAEGDLVAIGYPVEILGDPGAWYTTNLVRLRDGKIVEWWYSGYPQGHRALRYGVAWPIGAGPRPGVMD